MGPAHSTVKNHTERRICVITFTYTDLLYFTYNTLYTIEPGETRLVESQPDATGLKVAIIYAIDKNKKEWKYQRFACKMDSVLNISEIDYEHGDISWYGDNITGYSAGKFKETNTTALTMAYEAVQNLQPTVGQRGGKFEKELIKRVATEYMDSRNQSNIGESSVSSPHEALKNTSNSVIPPQSSLRLQDNRSAAEKWEIELQRMKLASAEQEKKLNESKAILNKNLARLRDEEEKAAEIEAKRLELVRLDELREKQLAKELAEKEQELRGEKLKRKNKTRCAIS